MWWECSECGCRVRWQPRPERCPECGIAGFIFAQADSDSGWEPGGGTLRDYWLEVGMSEMSGLTLEPTAPRQHW